MIVPTPFKLRNCNPKKLINAEAQPELGAFRRERRGITLQSFKNGSILTIVLCVSASLRWYITWVCHASSLVVGPFVFRGGSGIPPGLDTPVFRRSNQRNHSFLLPFLMLLSSRRPSRTMLTVSSAEHCLPILRRIPRTNDSESFFFAKKHFSWVE